MKGKNEKQIKDALAKNHSCYVLITCDEANAKGDMQVEMSYEGDADLAAYILQGAQNFIADEVEEESTQTTK